MAKLLTYEKKDTWMDELCGVTKLVYFLAWSITSMLTYDTRVLAVMLVLSFVFFKASKTEWKQVGSIFKVILFFLVVNVLAIFLFAPDQGVKIYGTRHVLVQLAGNYAITAEQLFYELNIILKYFTIIPAVFIFVVTTNPSEFAASLNRIGISYNIGYEELYKLISDYKGIVLCDLPAEVRSGSRVWRRSSFRLFSRVWNGSTRSATQWSCVDLESTKSAHGIWEENYSGTITLH